MNEAPMINDKAMSAALDAIHDEAMRLLAQLPEGEQNLRDGVELIVSIARYKHDVRCGHQKD